MRCVRIGLDRDRTGRWRSENRDASGTRWMIGDAADHAFPSEAMLVMVGIFAERFDGLLDQADWTLEGGVRKQITATSAMELSLGRHFHGVSHSWIHSLGASLELNGHT
jgi:hypothetical protein